MMKWVVLALLLAGLGAWRWGSVLDRNAHQPNEWMAASFSYLVGIALIALDVLVIFIWGLVSLF